MPATTLNSPAATPTASSLLGKLLNMIASPAEVFDEIIIAPTRLANWYVPTLLVCLAGIISLQLGVTAVQTLPASANWRLRASVAFCFLALAGTFWSAFVLWFMGRVFL